MPLRRDTSTTSAVGSIVNDTTEEERAAEHEPEVEDERDRDAEDIERRAHDARRATDDAAQVDRSGHRLGHHEDESFAGKQRVDLVRGPRPETHGRSVERRHGRRIGADRAGSGERECETSDRLSSEPT